MKSFREWYFCDNLLRDTTPFLQERDGHPASGAGWLAILNPSPDQPATETLTIYSDELPTEPVTRDIAIPAGAMELVNLHALPEVPRNTFFGLGLRSDLPVLPQVSWFEFRPWDLNPDATISKTMYAGPLSETEWYFPDGWQGGGPGTQMLWYERETLTLLNPGDEEAKVTLTFFSYGHTADVELWVPPRRLKTVPLYDIPGLRFRWVEERKTRMIDFSLRVTSDRPIVPQKTRRAYVQTESSVQGIWTSFGYPYPLAERQQEQRRIWHYPGGFVQDIGLYPRDDPHAFGWDLFFVFNPDSERTAHCTATFLYEEAPPQTLEFDVEPLRQKLHWLHFAEYRHLTGLNQPYAVTVESDNPLIPHFLRAEYESWTGHSPTAMFGVIPHEGPLTDQTEWWLPEGFWQDRDDHPWVEQEWIQIVNPEDDNADVVVRFLLPDGTPEYRLEVPAGHLRVVKLEEIGIVPNGSHYGIHVRASTPVVVQQSRRTRQKGGTAATLSTTATLGIPYHAE